MTRIIPVFVCCCFYLLTNGQNVGIGTVAPTRGKLVVSGLVGRTNTIIASGAAGGGVSLQANLPAVGFNHYFSDQSRYINNGRAAIWFLHNVTGSLNLDVFNGSGIKDNVGVDQVRVMTIAQTGNISLGAGEADASLYVAYSPTNYITRFQGTTYHSEFNRVVSGAYSTRINGGKVGSDLYINDQSSGSIFIAGLTGVNMDPPVAVLDIEQYNRGFVLVEPSTFHNWEIIATKNLTDPASDLYLYYNGAYRGNFFYIDGGWYPISDARLKKNVQPMTNGLNGVLQLRPVQYRMKAQDNSGKKIIGFLAQQVRSIFPELVDVINDQDTGYPGINDLHTMSYEAMGPVIISAIQEQQQKIAELEQLNSDLRKRIDAIKKLKAEIK